MKQKESFLILLDKESFSFWEKEQSLSLHEKIIFSPWKKKKKTVVQETDVKWRQRQAKRVAYMEELGEAHQAANQPAD